MNTLDQSPPSAAPSAQVFELMTSLVVRGFGLGTAISIAIVSVLILF